MAARLLHTPWHTLFVLHRGNSHPWPSLHLSTSHSSSWKPIKLSGGVDAKLAYAFQPRQRLQLSGLTTEHEHSRVDMSGVLIWAGPTTAGEINTSTLICKFNTILHAILCTCMCCMYVCYRIMGREYVTVSILDQMAFRYYACRWKGSSAAMVVFGRCICILYRRVRALAACCAADGSR